MSDREPLDRPFARIVRVPEATTPSGRVPLDWWQLPSISSTSLQPIVGEAGHQAAIAAVAARWPSRNVIAQLLVEPTNPHDRHAVMVLLDGYPVGHLSRDRDPRFTGLVRHLALTQGPVRARARITGGDGLRWGVTLYADPEPFDPRVDFLSGPRSEGVHCTDEQRRLGDELALLSPRAAHLRVDDEGDGDTSPGERVQVVVHGRPVGVLGASASADYLPLVRAALERGFTPSCRVAVHCPSTDVSSLRVTLLQHPEDLADICG